MNPNRATQLAFSLAVALGLGASARPAAAGPMYSAATKLSPSQAELAHVDAFEPGAQHLRWVVDHPRYGQETPAAFAADLLEPTQVTSSEPSIGREPPRLAGFEGLVAGGPPSHASSGAINPAALSAASPQPALVSHPDQAVTPASTPAEPPPSQTFTASDDRAPGEQEPLNATPTSGTDTPDATPIADTSASPTATGEIATNNALTPPSQIEPTGVAAHSGTPDAPPSSATATTPQSQVAALPAGDAASVQDAASLLTDGGAAREPRADNGVASWDQPSRGESSIIGESLVLAVSGADHLRASATEDGQALDVNGLLKTAMSVELARASAITDAGRILAEPDFQTSWETVGGNSGTLGPPTLATAPPPPLTTPEPATWILFAALCLPLLHRAKRAAASRPVTR